MTVSHQPGDHHHHHPHAAARQGGAAASDVQSSSDGTVGPSVGSSSSALSSGPPARATTRPHFRKADAEAAASLAQERLRRMEAVISELLDKHGLYDNGFEHLSDLWPPKRQRDWTAMRGDLKGIEAILHRKRGQQSDAKALREAIEAFEEHYVLRCPACEAAWGVGRGGLGGYQRFQRREHLEQHCRSKHGASLEELWEEEEGGLLGPLGEADGCEQRVRAAEAEAAAAEAEAAEKAAADRCASCSQPVAPLHAGEVEAAQCERGHCYHAACFRHMVMEQAEQAAGRIACDACKVTGRGDYYMRDATVQRSLSSSGRRELALLVADRRARDVAKAAVKSQAPRLACSQQQQHPLQASNAAVLPAPLVGTSSVLLRRASAPVHTGSFPLDHLAHACSDAQAADIVSAAAPLPGVLPYAGCTRSSSDGLVFRAAPRPRGVRTLAEAVCARRVAHHDSFAFPAVLLLRWGAQVAAAAWAVEERLGAAAAKKWVHVHPETVFVEGLGCDSDALLALLGPDVRVGYPQRPLRPGDEYNSCSKLAVPFHTGLLLVDAALLMAPSQRVEEFVAEWEDAMDDVVDGNGGPRDAALQKLREELQDRAAVCDVWLDAVFKLLTENVSLRKAAVVLRRAHDELAKTEDWF